MYKYLILLVVLATSATLFVLSVNASPTTEDWTDLSDWTSSGCGLENWQRQDGNLLVRSYSCGLYFNATFSRDSVVAIEAAVRCRPATSHNRCWAGVKIGNIAPDRGDDYPICQYGNENVAYNVWSSSVRNIVGLVNCYSYLHGSYTPWTWHTLKVMADPAAGDYVYYSLYVDGSRKSRVFARLNADLRPKIECVSAVQNGPGDGSLAECEFGPLSITTGVSPTPTPKPTPTPTFVPIPWWCKIWSYLC